MQETTCYSSTPICKTARAEAENSALRAKVVDLENTLSRCRAAMVASSGSVTELLADLEEVSTRLEEYWENDTLGKKAITVFEAQQLVTVSLMKHKGSLPPGIESALTKQTVLESAGLLHIQQAIEDDYTFPSTILEVLKEDTTREP